MPQDDVEAKPTKPSPGENQAEGGGGSVVRNAPRQEFSRATKHAAWERCGGRCEGTLAPTLFDIGIRHVCGAPIDTGRFHYDHIDPDWYSKNNELENCQVLCIACHTAKTAIDVANIAKSKRIQDKRIKAKTSKRPMAFGRGSRFKRKLDGTVVERVTGERVR